MKKINQFDLLDIHPTIPQISGKDVGQTLEPGKFYLANEGSFSESQYSEPLTTYQVGYAERTDLLKNLNFLAPPQKVDRRSELHRDIPGEFLLSETDDVRAIGAEFKELEYNSFGVQIITYNKGLCVKLDLDRYADIQLASRLAVQRLTDRLLRNELLRVKALATANASVSVNYTWSSGIADPHSQVALGLFTAGGYSGMPLNRVAWGQNAALLKESLYAQNLTPGAFQGMNISEEKMAEIIGVDKVLHFKNRIQTAPATKSGFIDNLVIGFFGVDQGAGDPEEFDYNNFRRFWTPPTGTNGAFRVYSMQTSTKFITIAVEHYSNIVLLNKPGIFVATIS